MDVIPPSHLRHRRAAVLLLAAAAAVSPAPLATVVLAQPPGGGPIAKTMLIEPPPPLLPAKLGKLKRVAEGDVGDGLSQVDAPDVAVLMEDGLKRFARSDYAQEGVAQQGGAGRVSITAYRFRDASGAVAAYDYFRKPGMRPEKLGDEAVADANGLLLRSGVSVVRLSFGGPRGPMDALAGELIAGLPKVGGTAELAPPLPQFLPAEGLDADSVKYAFGPADYQATGGVLPSQTVGFDKSAETVTAKYKDGGVLTLLEYPTPEIAGERGRAIEAELASNGAAAAGTVKLRREGPLLMVATGAWKPAEAGSLIEGIHLRDQLTWNKPMPLEFHAEVQKTYSLLVSIAILCGVGALAALVLGLFFGGGRALIRVMQGKPAASEPEFLRIDLRGPAGKSLGKP